MLVGLPAVTLYRGRASGPSGRSAWNSIYAALDRDLAVKAYFRDPHSPWQKGAVENANGRVIRFPADVFGDGSCGVTQPVGWALACGRRTRGGGGGTLERGGAGGAVP